METLPGPDGGLAADALSRAFAWPGAARRAVWAAWIPEFDARGVLV
jgi:hypothetical protein